MMRQPMILQSRNEALDARALRLFDSLPEPCRLSLTRQRFPHVLNHLAAEWDAPPRFARLMNDLLLDGRGNRHGFPPETVRELSALHDHYFDFPWARAQAQAPQHDKACVWEAAQRMR